MHLIVMLSNADLKPGYDIKRCWLEYFCGYLLSA